MESPTSHLTDAYAERFPPLDEEAAKRLRAHHESVAFEHYLGMQQVTLRAGYCELALDNRPELGQQHGYVHGGVIGALVDTASGHAALTVVPEGHSAVTVEYKLNFLAPASGARLAARSAVVRRGRQMSVCRTDVLDQREDREVHCATALVTYMNVAPR